LFTQGGRDGDIRLHRLAVVRYIFEHGVARSFLGKGPSSRPHYIMRNSGAHGSTRVLVVISTQVYAVCQIRASYAGLQKREARALVQLRTGSCRLNSYLYKIKAVDSAECLCGAATESIKHYLFTCEKWHAERTEMRSKWPEKIGDSSFFFGGREAEEEAKGWQPNGAAVRAAIGFAIATARLEAGEQEG
jgi:hypothetical protein